MKNRNGFVSNSSSTSFVVLLPDGFNPDLVDFTPYARQIHQGNSDEEKCRMALSELVRTGSMQEYDHWTELQVIAQMFVKMGLVIGDSECGPDRGSISIADTNKVKKILGVQS